MISFESVGPFRTKHAWIYINGAHGKHLRHCLRVNVTSVTLIWFSRLDFRVNIFRCNNSMGLGRNYTTLDTPLLNYNQTIQMVQWWKCNFSWTNTRNGTLIRTPLHGQQRHRFKLQSESIINYHVLTENTLTTLCPNVWLSLMNAGIAVVMHLFLLVVICSDVIIGMKRKALMRFRRCISKISIRKNNVAHFQRCCNYDVLL